MADADPDDAEPGLQRERTRLSWTRTALSMAGVGALLVHAGRAIASVPAEVPGFVVLIFAGIAFVGGQRRYRWRVRCEANMRRLAAPSSLLALSLAVIAAAVAGGVLLLLGVD